MTSQVVDIAEPVIAKLQELPLEQQKQVLEFVEFLAQKYANRKSRQARIAGLNSGEIWMSEDFNSPMSDEIF